MAVTIVLGLLAVGLLVYLGTRHVPETQPGAEPPKKAFTLGPSPQSPGNTTSSPGPTASPEEPRPVRTARFRVGTFNVLGSSHTVDGNRGYRTGPTRAADAGRVIATRHLDVVGLQELQRNQVEPLLETAGGYSIYPGLKGPRHGSQNSIAWRTQEWELVAGNTNQIAYFHGTTMPMPVVKLRQRSTGMTVVFLNFHNPANTKQHGKNDRWRDVATRQQIALLRKVIAAGENVVVTGDMNAHRRYFCAVTTTLPMHASNQTEYEPGRCTPPHPIYIDWILGGPTVTFQGHTRDRSALVRRATDHPLVYADAKVRSTIE
ncbi:MAG: endonuclease/exonuclease/phosphatase family protein [Nocardioidaceae bacterium]